MHALPGTPAEKAVQAIRAGCDAVCYALGDYDEMAAITQNCPPLSDLALERLGQISKVTVGTQPSFDFKTAAQRYDSIVGKVEPYVDTYDATEVLNLMKQKGKTC